MVAGTVSATTQIKRAHADDFAIAWFLLDEYFESVQVQVRDDKYMVRKYLEESASGIWLAYQDGEPAGCIALRPLPSKSSSGSTAGEVKRLYVRPDFRLLGIARLLLAELESYALQNGVRALYLDSKDDLRQALSFYEQAGYKRCERYNDNPQATIFLKKVLAPAIQVRHFRAGDESAFWSLNEAWISKLFKLEEKDFQTLKQPDKYILSKGGRIYMACRGDAQVGCCALLNLGNGSYELGKMGVAESERGKGVGRALLLNAIEDARRSNIHRLYLETNHILVNAVHLYQSVGFSHLKPEDITPSPYERADVFMEMFLN